MQDMIQREIIINAPKQRIYDAIADPEKLTRWFPDAIDGSYKVGEQPVFLFGNECRNRVYIVAAEPHEYFAYRWVPGASDSLDDVLQVPNTLVEFRINEQGDGTCRVVLTESGFAALPAEMIENAHKQNSDGWDFMLGRLSDYFQDA